MELNSPFKSRIYIIMIVILFLIGIISLFINVLLSKNNVINSINLKEVIINNKELNECLKNRDISKEALEYIDDNVIEKMSIAIIDKLYKGEENLVDKEDILDVIRRSIYKYEGKISDDVYLDVKEDVGIISNIISESINSRENIDRYNTIRSTVFMLMFSLAFAISFSILLLMSEKKGFLVYEGTIFIAVSFIILYLRKPLVNILYNNLDIINLLGINLDKCSKDISSIMCGIIMAIGVVMIFIYIITEGRHAYRKLRTAYLDKYY